jgi:hypothetical protein
MANLYDTGATSALNEDKYINKLYDSTLDAHKNALQQSYDKSLQQLTTGQQNTQKQTSDYLQRAYTDGVRATNNVQQKASPTVSGIGAAAQSRLTMGNQQQSNKTTLQNQQIIADQEYERIRALRGQQYAAEIKKAQANNDMNRAQMLYDAAKAEEEQLRNLRQEAANLMYSKGDSSIVDAIAKGEAVTKDTTTETWENVLKNEADINKIYDAQLEAERQAAELSYIEDLSKLEELL